MADQMGKQFAARAQAQQVRFSLGVRSPARCLVVDDREIAWEEIRGSQADEQPVICLHDAGSGSREFRPLLDLRPKGSRLILFDWPGHGRSSDDVNGLGLEQCAKVLLAVSNQLGLARPILLGTGFGAAVAIHFAAQHPARIKGLVLAEPAGLFPPARRTPGFLLGWRQRVSKWVHGKPTTSGERQSRRQVAFRRITHDADHSARHAMERAVADLERAQQSLTGALPSLNCPILFALSRDSRAYPLSTYMGLLEPLLKPGSRHRLTVFSGGFSPIWDEPERFAQALTSFVQAQMPVDQHSHAWLLSAADWPTRNTNLWKCVHPECLSEKVLPAGQNANEVAGAS